MNIAVIPYSKEVYDNKTNQFGRHTERYCLEKGHRIETLSRYSDWSEIDWFLFWEFDTSWGMRILEELNARNMLDKTILFMVEPNVVVYWHNRRYMGFIKKFFAIIISQDKRLADDKSIFYLVDRYFPNKEGVPEGLPFAERKLLCNISGYKKSSAKNELYSERQRVIRFFEKKHESDFDLYGVGWQHKTFPSYVGTCESKREVYKKYRFALCLENAAGVSGYVTEKIHDCINSGIVPIYVGAPDIEEYVPKDCFIDYASFSSLDEMYECLSSMKEEEWRQYIEAQKRFVASGWYSTISEESWWNGIISATDKRCQYQGRNKAHISPIYFVLAKILSLDIVGKIFRKIWKE